MQRATTFFHLYVAPELVSITTATQMISYTATSTPVAVGETAPVTVMTSNVPVISTAGPSAKPLLATKKKKSKVKRSKRPLYNLYLCGSCTSVCKEVEDIKLDRDNSVGCDNCYT